MRREVFEVGNKGGLQNEKPWQEQDRGCIGSSIMTAVAMSHTSNDVIVLGLLIRSSGDRA